MLQHQCRFLFVGALAMYGLSVAVALRMPDRMTHVCDRDSQRVRWLNLANTLGSKRDAHDACELRDFDRPGRSSGNRPKSIESRS